MTKTKYEGLYYKLNKKSQKVYVARIFHNGGEIRRVLGNEPNINLKTANTLRLKLIDEVKGNQNTKNRTLNELFSEYQLLRGKTLSENWVYGGKLTWNKYVRDKIGFMYPEQVKAQDIQNIINAILESGKAVSTAKQIKDYVGGLFKHLPMLGVKGVNNLNLELTIPKFDNTRTLNITMEKAQELINAIFEYEDIKYRTMFIWLLHGRRKGEVSKIKWEHLRDDEYDVIAENSKISKTLTFPMTDILKKALDEYGRKKSGLIFGAKMDANKIINKSILDSHWKKIKKQVALDDIHIHDLRHLIGFVSVNSGVSMENIARALGHSSIAVTKRYSNMKVEGAKTVTDNFFKILKPPQS